MKTGIKIIADERQRQIDVEGWTPKHDDVHKIGELAMASVCYAMPEKERKAYHIDSNYGLLPCFWPYSWSPVFWKPTPDDRIKELAKAGALIAAEIDRLQRINKM